MVWALFIVPAMIAGAKLIGTGEVMRYILCALLVLLVVSCSQNEERRSPFTTQVKPNIEIDFVPFGASTRVILSTGEISAEEPFLCIGLSTLRTYETKDDLASLSEYLAAEEPLKGYNSIVIDASPSVDSRVVEELLSAAHAESIQKIAMSSCRTIH